MSVLMTAGWAFYVAAWTSADPGASLQAIGLPLTNKDLWSISDAMFGVAAMAFAWSVWWGWAFWLIALVQVAAHIGYKFTGHDFAAYAAVLDNLLRAQIALFFIIGGRGVADRVLRACRRLRDAGRTAYPAFQRSRAR